MLLFIAVPRVAPSGIETQVADDRAVAASLQVLHDALDNLRGRELRDVLRYDADQLCPLTAKPLRQRIRFISSLSDHLHHPVCGLLAGLIPSVQDIGDRRD